MPPEESDVVLVFAGGNRRDGVIIATGNQTYRMRNSSRARCRFPTTWASRST
jgi:phage gp45-like